MLSEKVKNLSLSESEVKKRIEEGHINRNAASRSKTIKRIILENTLTLFNFLNLFLMVLLLIVGSYKNMLFMGVVLCNTVIGIVQEIRSKKAIDRLSIVVTSSIDVVRNGEIINISVEEIVKDDIIILKSGAQIPCDCVIIEGDCFANESLLTGESDRIEKAEGDRLLSGSFISAGMVYAKVEKVGGESYASKLQQEATYHKKINSEIMFTLNRIIRFCSIAIFPMGTALFINQYFFNHMSLENTVVSTVAALIGMIPEGLILLTSTVLAVSVVRLSRKNVLVQQLFCIETLARVDVLCLDKTGTITTGELEVVDIKYLNDDKNSVDIALKSLSEAFVDKNATMSAIDNYLKCSTLKANKIVHFSSEKKWSGAQLENNKSYVVGAAEFIYNNSYLELFNEISKIDDTLRVISVGVSDEPFKENDVLPDNIKPLALVIIKDKIRESADKTIRYFNEQGVALKVISGDNDKTVRRIAQSVGVINSENSIDASLITDDTLKEAVEKYTVFGRVTPQQKKKFVEALKSNGHTVAMTGDGVNDVLALKEADCSIAVASGSDASKNISQLVLADDNFASMPKVVAEGRRSINNIQRSASLFIVKTLYSIVLALAFVFINTNYPFRPLQLSLISAFTIGIPSFVLALQPNHNRIQGRFIKNVIMRAWPAALVIVLNIFTLVFFMRNYSYDELSTMSVVLTALVGFMMVVRLSIPFNILRTLLVIVTGGGLLLGIFVFGFFFNITALCPFALWLTLILAGSSVILYNVLYTVSCRIDKVDN